MALRTLARRFIFSLSVTVAFFGLLEAGLWVAGGVARALIRERVSAEEPQGAATLLCLGDSVTFGLGVDTEDAYPALLAATLPGWRVVNLGKPGITTLQVAEVMEEWLETTRTRGRTRALLLSGFNDCAQLPGLLFPRARSERPGRDLIQRSRTYRLARQILLRLRPMGLGPGAPGGHGARDAGDDLGRCAAALNRGLDNVESLCRAADIDLTLLSYPVPAQRVSEAGSINVRVDDLLSAEAAARGLPLVDLRPCMQARELLGQGELYQLDGIHLTVEGYVAMVSCLGRALEEAGW